MCSIHKPGGMGLDETTISGAIKIMEDKIKGLTETLRANIKNRNQSWWATKNESLDKGKKCFTFFMF